MRQLLILNLALQIFDGLATYHGTHLGMSEANPLLRHSFHFWGVASSLLLFKSFACGALLLVYQAAGRQLATVALGVLACVYFATSFVPWLTALVGLLVVAL